MKLLIERLNMSLNLFDYDGIAFGSFINHFNLSLSSNNYAASPSSIGFQDSLKEENNRKN